MPFVVTCVAHPTEKWSMSSPAALGPTKAPEIRNGVFSKKLWLKRTSKRRFVLHCACGTQTIEL